MLAQPEITRMTEQPIAVTHGDWLQAVTVCRLTGWDAVADRLERGWRPEPGTSEYQVALAFARHRLAERERCAKVADVQADNDPRDLSDIDVYDPAWASGWMEGAERIATTIRSSSDAE